MKRRKNPSLKKEFAALMREHECSISDMFTAMQAMPGIRGVSLRTFTRWVNGDFSSQRARDTLEALQRYYGSASNLDEIKDPVTALRALQEIPGELDSISESARLLLNRIERVATRQRAISAALKIPADD